MQWHHDLGLTAASTWSTGPMSWHTTRARPSMSYQFPFGWQEIEGIHNRGDFDLGRHQEVLPQEAGSCQRALSPLHDSAGVDRVSTAAQLPPVDAYREEDVEGETRVVLARSGDRPDQGGSLPAGQEGRERRAGHGATSSSASPAFTTTAAQSGGDTGGWTRPALRSASRSTATRPRRGTVTVRHRDSMQQERVGLDQVVEERLRRELHDAS